MYGTAVSDGTVAGVGLGLEGTAAGDGTAAGVGLGLVGCESRGLHVVAVADNGGSWAQSRVAVWRTGPKEGVRWTKPALHYYREMSRFPWPGPRLRD